MSREYRSQNNTKHRNKSEVVARRVSAVECGRHGAKLQEQLLFATFDNAIAGLLNDNSYQASLQLEITTEALVSAWEQASAN